MEEVLVTGGKIISIPFIGEHGDLNIRSKTAWCIELDGKRVFFGADSSNVNPYMYSHIQKVIGNVDVLAIGMECVGAPYTWLYGALHTRKVSKAIKNSRRLNGSDSLQAINMVETFNPEQVYLYALGMEPCFKYFMGIDYNEDSAQLIESKKMLELCTERGIIAEALYGKKEILLS